jgi:hypothetical protein
LDVLCGDRHRAAPDQAAEKPEPAHVNTLPPSFSMCKIGHQASDGNMKSSVKGQIFFCNSLKFSNLCNFYTFGYVKSTLQNNFNTCVPVDYVDNSY